jgi:hypothetical protein
MGKDAPHAEVLAEVERRFKPYDHSMGIQVEPGHSYMQTAETSPISIQKAIAEDRLFGFHPNDSTHFGDPDHVYGTVHFGDAVEQQYHMTVAGLIGSGVDPAKEVEFEADSYPMRGDIVKIKLASINWSNMAQAVVQNIIKLEGIMRKREALTPDEERIQRQVGTLESGESIYDIADEGRKAAALAYAQAMRNENLRLIPVEEAAASFREFIGKPHRSASRRV